MLRHDWLVQRFDYEDGDTNIIWGFAYIATRQQFSLKFVRFRHDGLPIRMLNLGWLTIGWGQTHEWFCCDKEET